MMIDDCDIAIFGQVDSSGHPRHILGAGRPGAGLLHLQKVSGARIFIMTAKTNSIIQARYRQYFENEDTLSPVSTDSMGETIIPMETQVIN